MWKRAGKDTLSFFGWNKRTTIPLLLWALGAYIYWKWQGVVAVLEEISVTISFGLIPVAIFLIGLYAWNLIRAPVFLRFEKKMEPCLEILEYRRQDVGAYREGFCWGLRIRNSGTEPAEGCNCHLLQVFFESNPRTLKGFPIDRPFHWAGQSEDVPDFVIPGGQTARLNVIYHDYRDQIRGIPSSITLAYRMKPELRLRYELSAFTEPILLLFSLTSRGKLPKYVVCRIDLEALVQDLAIQPKPPCGVLWEGTERRDLAEFTKSNQEISS